MRVLRWPIQSLCVGHPHSGPLVVLLLLTSLGVPCPLCVWHCDSRPLQQEWEDQKEDEGREESSRLVHGKHRVVRSSLRTGHTSLGYDIPLDFSRFRSKQRPQGRRPSLFEAQHNVAAIGGKMGRIDRAKAQRRRWSSDVSNLLTAIRLLASVLPAACRTISRSSPVLITEPRKQIRCGSKLFFFPFFFFVFLAWEHGNLSRAQSKSI